MKITIKDMRNYLKLKDLRKELLNSENPFHKIYVHETGIILNGIEGLRNLVREGLEDDNFANEMLWKAYPLFKNTLELIPLTEVKEFSKKGLISETPVNIYKLFADQKKAYEELYNSNIELVGNPDTHLYLNSTALRAFISTNMGDAIKWSPKKEKIKITVDQSEAYIGITIENKFGKKPTREKIGMDQKIGSEYTNLFSKTLDIVRNETQDNNIFKKEFYIPKL